MSEVATNLAKLIAGETISLRNSYLYNDPEIGLLYQWLRDHAPAYRDTNGLVHVSRFADVAAIEHNAQRYTSSLGTVPLVDMAHDESMINLDDPHHAAHRRLIVRRFTPHGMKPHNERIQAIVASCIDGFAPLGHCDLISDLAAVLPAKVISELLGFGDERWRDCERWARETVGSANFLWDDPNVPDFMGAFVEFVSEVTELIGQRRREPTDDLISLWIGSEIDGEPMSDKQIVEEALLVLDGGAETTRGVLGLGTLALLQHPEQRARVVQDPTLLERTAVEEMVRWVTPVQHMRRTVTEAHQLHDVFLHEGDQIVLLYGAANRDERSINDPNTFDVGRSSNHHLGFGFGTHYCVGANLARFEIRTCMEELFRRLPDFKLAAGADPQPLPGMFTRGLESLPLEFTPERSRT